MYSRSFVLSMLTMVIFTALSIPMAEAKGGGGGGGGGRSGGTAGAGNARGIGRGGGVSGVGGYGTGGNYGIIPNQDPQNPKKSDQASDTSNYGRGSTK
jgi:hypothetical protein